MDTKTTAPHRAGPRRRSSRGSQRTTAPDRAGEPHYVGPRAAQSTAPPITHPNTQKPITAPGAVNPFRCWPTPNSPSDHRIDTSRTLTNVTTEDASDPDENVNGPADVVDGAVVDVDGALETEASVQPEVKPAVDWDAARELFESQGLSMREIAGRIGVSPNTVSTHARRDGWERDDATVAARDAQRRANAQAAVEANREAWSQRRATEADEAAASAKIARLGTVEAIGERDWHMTRSCAIAYGIFIDKAQLLTGGATSRVDGGAESEQLARSQSRRDELTERRERMAS